MRDGIVDVGARRHVEEVGDGSPQHLKPGDCGVGFRFAPVDGRDHALPVGAPCDVDVDDTRQGPGQGLHLLDLCRQLVEAGRVHLE